MYRYIGDTGIATNFILNNFAVALVFLYNFLNFKKKKDFLSNRAQYYIRRNSLRKKRLLSNINLWVFFEICIISYVQYNLCSVFAGSLGESLGTGDNYFGILFGSPVVLHVLFYFISINPLKQMDLITPAFPLALIPVKIACFCFGCCRGFECSWGMYFPSVDVTCFPTQLLEVAQAIILFIFLQKYKNKAKEGTLFPIYLTIYSATRFFTEFTSYRYKFHWEIFNVYHVLCFIGVIVGLIYLGIVSKWSDKIIYLYDRGLVFENGKRKRIRRKKH